MSKSLLYLLDYAHRGTRTFDHVTLALVTALGRAGWRVRLAFSDRPAAAFAADLAAAGAEWVVVPFPFTRRSAREMTTALGEFRPDVLLTSFLSPFTPALLGLKLGGYTRRLVVNDHSSGAVAVRQGPRRWLTQARGRLVGRVIDALLPVSEHNARRAVGRVFLPADKVRVVTNGIQLDRFPCPDRPARPVARVVFAGQLIPEKGVATLLRADRLLRAEGAGGYELLVAGAGRQAAELRAYARPGVRFLGHVDSVPELFATADVVVVPSEWAEAFGLVAAEAMACGAAVLASDAGALPDVVGDAGLVFRARDAGHLADRLAALLAAPDLRRRLGAAGRARVEKHFTLDRRVAELVGLIEAVAAGRPVHDGTICPGCGTWQAVTAACGCRPAPARQPTEESGVF